jgi:hypothetical protein
MKDIQGSGGSWCGFMTTNAMTFGPDLLMLISDAKLSVSSQQPADIQKLAWPGTYGPPEASITLQHHLSDSYGGYSRVLGQLVWFHDHKCHDFWSRFADECQDFSHI